MDYSNYSLFRPYHMPVTKHGTLGIPLAGGGNLIYQMRKIELSISSITQPKIQQISWDLEVQVQRFFFSHYSKLLPKMERKKWQRGIVERISKKFTIICRL